MDVGSDPERGLEGRGRESALRVAEHYARTGQLDRAASEIERAIARDPENPDLHARLGFIRELQDRPDEAKDAAELALSLDAEHVEALALLGQAESDLGRNREAERHFLAALRLSPEHPVLLRIYGRLMLRAGELRKAKGLLEASLARDPSDEATHSLLSLVETELRRSGDARRRADAGLQVAPDEALPHIAQAVACFSSGRIFRARRHVREAMRIDPSNDKAEELFRDIDLHGRVVALPFYWWSILVRKLPGQQFFMWGMFVAILMVLRRTKAPPEVSAAISIPYVSFCIYTWLALPLARGWVRMFPPRL